MSGIEDVVEVYDELGSTSSSGFHASTNIMDKAFAGKGCEKSTTWRHIIINNFHSL